LFKIKNFKSREKLKDTNITRFKNKEIKIKLKQINDKNNKNPLNLQHIMSIFVLIWDTSP